MTTIWDAAPEETRPLAGFRQFPPTRRRSNGWQSRSVAPSATEEAGMGVRRGFWQRRFGSRAPDEILADADAGVLTLADAVRWLGWRPLEVLDEVRRERRPRRLGRWWTGQRVFVVEPPWKPWHPPEPLILARIRDRAIRRELGRRRAAGDTDDGRLTASLARTRGYYGLFDDADPAADVTLGGDCPKRGG